MRTELMHMDGGSASYGAGTRWTYCGSIVRWTQTLRELDEDVTCSECIRLALSPGR